MPYWLVLCRPWNSAAIGGASGLGFVVAANPTWGAHSLAATLVLIGVIGIIWRQSRARTRRRLRDVLNAYADREIAGHEAPIGFVRPPRSV